MRARRKVRANASQGHNPADVAPSPTAAEKAIAAACSSAAEGFALCASRTRDEVIAVAARSASEVVRAIAAQIPPGVHKKRMGDRLRWEWLVSTAIIVDGSPDARLLAECAKVMSSALAHVDAVNAELGARFRVASAEAYSLSAAVQTRRAPSVVTQEA